MFKKMKERAQAQFEETQKRLQAAMDPGETLIASIVATSAATKDTRVMGRSTVGLVAKTVKNAVNSHRYIDGPPGSVARRFPDDQILTMLVVSTQRLRLMTMVGQGIGQAMDTGDEIMRVERAELASYAPHSAGHTKLNFADGSFIVMTYTEHPMSDLNGALARMGVPQVAA